MITPEIITSLRELFRDEIEEHQIELQLYDSPDLLSGVILVGTSREVTGSITGEKRKLCYRSACPVLLLSRAHGIEMLVEAARRGIDALINANSHELEELLDKWILHDDLNSAHEKLIIDWRPQESLPEDYYN